MSNAEGQSLCACVYELNELCKSGTVTRLLVYLSVRLKGRFTVATVRNLPAFTGENELDKVQGIVINPFDEQPELVD